MTTNQQDLENNFAEMILAVSNETTMTPDQKSYIIDFLSEQLSIETECLERTADILITTRHSHSL